MDGQEVPASERLRLLTGVALFLDLPSQQLARVAELAHVVVFPPGAQIVRQGQPADAMYVIVAGRVQLRARSELGDEASEAVISWAGAGDVAGEQTLLSDERPGASCTALASTICLRLDRDDFRRALQQDWDLTHALLRTFAQRLRYTDGGLTAHTRDPLTGCYNRRALAELYERETARAQRAAWGASGARSPLAVLFVDVDGFKQINERHGHHTGDAVLRSVAAALGAATRATDLVGRYGGDEFIVLLPDADADHAEVVAGRAQSALRERPPGPVAFSLRMGAASASGSEVRSLEALVAEAQAAMQRGHA